MSVLLRFTASHYPLVSFGNALGFSLYCLSFYALRLLITTFGIFWPLYCLSFYALRLLITPLVSFGVVLSVLQRFTASHYSFGIFWPLYCPSTLYGFSLLLWYLLVHCIVCPSTLYGFSLLLWYLLAIVLSVLLRFTASHYSFGIFWPLYCLSFYALRLLITPLVSFGHCIVCPSTLYGFSLPFGIFWPLYCLSFYALRLLITPLVSFGHCIVCPSTLYGFSLLLWYLLVIVLSVLLRFTASHYSFGIFWPLYCLSFYALRLLITPLVSFGHCIVCPSTLYGFSDDAMAKRYQRVMRSRKA